MPVLPLLTRFILSAVIGAAGAFGVAAVMAPGVASLAKPGPAETVDLATDVGEPVPFGLVALPDSPPVTLQALPDDKTLQLVAYAEPGTTPSTDPFRPAWTNALGFPRIPPQTQFDGGPLANANCVMASGAMLSRLGFGIVTTGSQMRSLQDDQAGGTSLSDLQTALHRGWGVSFSTGNLSALQLRSLLYAGAGAEILGRYGEIKAGYSLQPGFVDGHAIYLDGFRPAGPNGPAAYWVIDPLGRPSAGYKGSWWPADMVERFGTVFNGGRIMTAWTFPGGGTPAHYPALPPSSWPSSELPTPEPGASPTLEPTPIPLPSSAVESPPVVEPGEVPPIFELDPSIFELVPEFGGYAFDPSLLACIGPGAAAGCPDGLVGVYPAGALPVPTLPPLQLLGDVTLLYADSVEPGVLRVIFSVPDGSQAGLQYWPSDGSGGKLLPPSSIDAALLDGQVVQVASIPVEPGTDYHFVATAATAGAKAISAVGTIGQ